MLPLYGGVGLIGAGGVPTVLYKGGYSDTDGNSSFSSGSCDIGEPDSTRQIILAVGNQGTVTLSNLTVNGVAATILNTILKTSLRVTLAIAAVPSGSTGVTISGNTSGATDAVSVAWWRTTNLTSATPGSVDTDTSNVGTNITLTPTVASNGIVIAAAIHQSGGFDRRLFGASKFFAVGQATSIVLDDGTGTVWSGDITQDFNTLIDTASSNVGNAAFAAAFA